MYRGSPFTQYTLAILTIPHSNDISINENFQSFSDTVALFNHQKLFFLLVAH